MSDDYPLLLRDKLTEELLNSSFNQSNPNFPRYFNKSTISYFPTYNHFFLIEQENVQNEIKFNLWDVALDAMENIKNKTISKKFSIILENENNSEYKPSKEFCLEILNNSGFNEDFLVLYGGAHVFVAKIENFADLSNYTELSFQIIGSSLNEKSLIRLQWVPSTKDHIAFLREDNSFYIYDLGNNIDEPEITIDLNYLDSKKKLFEEKTMIFEDFAFSYNKDGYDCAIFSIFFMNNYGDIYYKCPIIVNGMYISKNHIEFLKKRIEHEKKANVADKELIDRIESFLKSINLIFQISRGGDYIVDISKFKGKIEMNESPIQGPIKIIDNEEDSKSSYRVLYKIPNTFNHIFVRIDQEGLISILLSPLNIWPSISKLQKDKNTYKSNISTDFQLAVIDKLLMNCDIKIPTKTKNNSDELMIRNIFKPMLYQNNSDKNVFYILFFNKFFEINIDWIDEFENCFFVANIAKIYENSLSHPNIRLIFDNPKIFKDFKLEEFKPIESCYYGCMVTNDYVWVFRSKGENCLIDVIRLNCQGVANRNFTGGAIFKKENIGKKEKLDFAEKEKKILKENDFESPAILNIEFVDNQQENIKRISDYFLKTKTIFEEIENKLQSKFRKTQKNFLEIVCEKEEIEKKIISLENMSIEFQEKEEKIQETQKTITNKIHAILEKTSEKSMKFIPNLSEFEDKLFKLTSNIQEINEKSSKLKERLKKQAILKESLLEVKMKEKEEMMVVEIFQMNRELKKKLEDIELLLIKQK